MTNIMEVEDKLPDTVTAQKRPLDEPLPDSPITKKAKMFSTKQLRKQLHTSDKLSALKEFSSILLTSTKHDYVLDYLKDGGNCLELLQTLESDSTIPPSIVFGIVSQVLLGITSKHGQYYNSAQESCRYLLNNYLPVIHKMIGLSSSKEERKVCLKLLTAIAALSSNLGRDILINVKFHSANIELLTKPTGEKSSVRDCFIHFLTAFLVDSDWHTLSVLLEKGSLLTSMVPGLQYDDDNTVCVVITAMKNHILENPAVKKTTKMHVFNTAVVKDIVNLYNWKGLDGFKALDKSNKNKVFEVDKTAKSRVSECIHNFLLVLCTSHKHGLIFRDHMVGLGKKNLNGLMYTVLESLERPWEHSYASDLVLKICRSCPDLTKNMWLNLKSYLEPRLTEKWINAMNFAHKLIDELDPTCLDYCVKELSTQQLAHIVEILVSPAPILKTLLVVKEDSVKVHILKLLHHMLERINIYLAHFQRSLPDVAKTKHHIANYVSKYYPKADRLLTEWEEKSKQQEDDDGSLKVVLDILDLYKTTAPRLLDGVHSGSFELEEFFNKCESQENQIKIVNIFVDIDSAFFLPKTQVFHRIVLILLKEFHINKTAGVKCILHKLLQGSGAFESCSNEIDAWINGIFNVTTLSDSFVNDFVDIVRECTENLTEYQREVSEEASQDDVSKSLIEDILSYSHEEDYGVKIKRRSFSVAVLALLKYLQKACHCRHLKKYAELVLVNVLHNQTGGSQKGFASLLGKYADVVPSNIFNYVVSCSQGSVTPLAKIKGSLSVFKDISEQFLAGSLNKESLDLNYYPDYLKDVLRMGTFYLANVEATELHAKNWICIIKRLIESNVFDDACLELAFGNYDLIHRFDIDDSNVSRAIVEAVTLIKDIDLERYKPHYSNKIFRRIMKNLKTHKPLAKVDVFLHSFPLSPAQCVTVLSQICSKVETFTEPVLFLLNYTLAKCDVQALDSHVMLRLTTILMGFVDTNHQEGQISLSKSLRDYLTLFPQPVDENLLGCLLKAAEYQKEVADLAVFLLKTDGSLKKVVEENADVVCAKKGLALPIVQLLLEGDDNDALLKILYEKLESSLLKAVQKPQKVGQHFLKDYTLAPLIEKFMPEERCKFLVEKVQKFEAVEVFHAKLLEACFSKFIPSADKKTIGNIVMTFVHMEVALLKRKLESETEMDKAKRVSEIFSRVLQKISVECSETGHGFTSNDSFKVFCKFALKYGVSGQHVLLKVLRQLLELSSDSVDSQDANLLFDMMLSHSEFLNVVLGEPSDCKLEVMWLFYVICRTWTDFMDSSHMPLLLSSYGAMVNECDRVILKILQLYESKPLQTRFHTFGPFLCGRAAATHYSVRSQIGNALNRQPKISEVLGILKEDLVQSTITNNSTRCYDLHFLLPLFNHVLAPEQQVKTYSFIRSGALSLTVIGLTSENRTLRVMSSFILSRLYFHLEARQTGKDSRVWIGYIKALCRGIDSNSHLNHFSAIFFARMALILTNPKHVMFTPLSNYLTAKEVLDLSTVPELYTLLFSSDVNFREHRTFILEVLRDGMRTEKDFLVFLRSMGFKLFSELYSSCACDLDTKALILEVLKVTCRIPLAVNMLVENFSLLPQLRVMVSESCALTISLLMNILSEIAAVREDSYTNGALLDLQKNLADRM